MEWNKKTSDLISIIKSLPIHLSTRMNNFTSGCGTVLTYKRDESQNICIIDYSWGHSTTANGITVVPATSPPVTGVSLPSIPPGPGWSTIVPSGTVTVSGNIQPVEPIRRVRMTVSSCLTHLLTLQWNELASGSNSQYVYRANAQGNFELDEGVIIMSALPLKNGKILVNGIMYDPDNSPDAFLDDITGSDVSVLKIIQLVKEFNGE